MDIFALINHKNEIINLFDISDLPSNIDKLIGAGLDPMVYSLKWSNENIADVEEFWWGTRPYKIVRVAKDLTLAYHQRWFHYKDTHVKTNLPTGLVASASPFHLNRMI